MRSICTSPQNEVELIALFDVKILGRTVISVLKPTSFIHACEWKTDHLPMRGWSMRNCSHWYLVDCEDVGTITVHCRGCLTSPCSLESLAYVFCPVINVNLCSLQSAVHFHFQADQLYFVYSLAHVSLVHLAFKVRLKDPYCIQPQTVALCRSHNPIRYTSEGAGTAPLSDSTTLF